MSPNVGESNCCFSRGRRLLHHAGVRASRWMMAAWISQPSSGLPPTRSSIPEQRLSSSFHDRCSAKLGRLRVPCETRAASSAGVTEAEEHEVLWRDLFLVPALWWDNRQDKKNSSHPDFRHKNTKRALWLDNRYKPAWVDAQLAIWDAQVVAASEPRTQIIKLCGEGDLNEAVEALGRMVQQGSYVDESLLYSVLQKCIKQKNLVLGIRVHALAVKCGYESSAFLANHIIRLYASHGRLEEATEVFTKVVARDTYVWASIILASAEHGQAAQAVKLYQQMRQSAVKPNSHIFVAVLKACAGASDFAFGQEVHAEILKTGLEHDVFIGSCLVDMYVKCGSLQYARMVFDKLPGKNVVTWTAMISGYAQNGLGEEALSLFSKMQHESITSANHFTFACLLQACASVGALQQGKQLHSRIQEQGLETDLIVGNSLVDMYAKCGSLKDARILFDKLPAKDVVTWTALLNGYAEHSDSKMAMQFFEEMKQRGVQPNGATFISLLVACCHEGLVNDGRRYFKMMVQDYGIAPSVHHYTCMVDLLARSGNLDEAEDLVRSTLLQNDAGAWISLLSACKSQGDLECGRRCFDHLIKLDPEHAAAYALLTSMYTKAGRLSDAERIESLRKSAGAWKKAAKATIEILSKVRTFTVGEDRDDISFKLQSVNLQLKGDGGHVPHTDLVMQAGPGRDKEDALCGHAEKLALAYGLINTPEGTTLLVTKNLRMCDDCHSGTKIMSRLEKREIIVRDAHRVHRFVDGACSCSDRL